MNPGSTIYYDNLDIKVLIGNLNINILYINYEAPRPSWYFSSHSHSSYEIHYIPSGKGKLRVMGKSFDISPGTLYLTGPGVIHEQKADEADPMCEYCMNFEIKLSNRKLSKNFTHMKNEVDDILQSLENKDFWYGVDQSGSLSLFEKITEELESGMIGCFTYVQSLAAQIIVNAARNFSDRKRAKYLIPKKTLNDSRRYVVDNYFRDFDKQLSPTELAKIIGTSVRQLERIVLEYYSMTFSEKLIRIRLLHAKELIANSTLTLREISERTGYLSQDGLCKAFKKIYNAAPSEFRT